MPLTRRSTVPVVVASVIALAGCNDATGPNLANRVFSAVSVEGAPLPVVLTASGTVEHRLLSDVLAFLVDGTARRTIRTSVLDRRTNVEHTETFERLTPYRVKGRRVILATVCPMNPASSASCIAPDTAFFDGPNLLLRTPTFERRQVLLVPVESPTLPE